MKSRPRALVILAAIISISAIIALSLWLHTVSSTHPLTGQSQSLQLSPSPANPSIYDLNTSWQLQSAGKVSTDGASISQSTFQPDNWYATALPTTVMGTLTAQRFFSQDPLVGTNLQNIDQAQFKGQQWWFRRSFSLPAAVSGQRIWLNLSGLNYQGQVWLNGRQLQDILPKDTANRFTGTFRTYAIDLTDQVKKGTNTLAIGVSRAQDIGQAFTNHFVDWNPDPPDLNMGVVGGVSLTVTNSVKIEQPYLVTNRLEGDSADVTAYVDLTATNATGGTVSGSLSGTSFSQKVDLKGGESTTAAISFTVQNPKIWWPWQYGTPALSDLHMSFKSDDGTASNQLSAQVGIRTVGSRLIDVPGRDPQRIFTVNGKDILIRGAAYSPDILLRQDPVREEEEMRYVRQLNLNALRFEGKFADDHLYQLADRYGILTISGWNCCDAFQEGDTPLTASQLELTGLSLRSQLYRLREHPSTLVWLNGSDKAPQPATLGAYYKIESELNWTPALPALSSATDLAGANQPSREDPSNPSGLKMEGPYWWVPPSYWEDPSNGGGAWGFASEVSPGFAIPVADSLDQFLPAGSFMDDTWAYHSPSGNVYSDFSAIQDVLHQYGIWKDNDRAAVSEVGQAEAYEAERAMFEAYGRKKYRNATGVIQWMLNNAWPGLDWHLYDYYLRPGGGYFGTKNALEPLHIQYSYLDRTVSVINSTLEARPNLTAQAQTYNLDGTKTWDSAPRATALDPDGVGDLFTVPVPAGSSSTYFLRLTLKDGDLTVSSQTYWLSTASANGNNPDYSALQQQPHIDLQTSDSRTEKGGTVTETVTLTNPSSNVDFFVHAGITKGNGPEVAPVYWDDNYVTLLPGESRTLTATYQKSDLGGTSPQVHVKSFADLT